MYNIYRIVDTALTLNDAINPVKFLSSFRIIAFLKCFFHLLKNVHVEGLFGTCGWEILG